MERPPEDEPRATPRPAEGAAPLQIAVRGAGAESWRSRAEAIGLTVTAVVSLAVGLPLLFEAPWAGLLVSVGIALSFDLLVLGPLLHLVRRVGAEGARLRAALACPYCKDALPDAAASACDQRGCGAFYHEECWAECQASYGGCAIYGCGGKTSHPVGRLALRRHVLRLVLATLLFTPRLVKRIQESEQLSFRDVWRRAREYQHGVSHDAGRTIAFGVLNAYVSVTLVVCFARAYQLDVISQGAFLLLVLPCLGLPILFMRTPLLAHFGWGASRVLASVFRAELAALRRADEGTFLARLAGGLGKKGD
jgi:hypothetical protein